MYTDGKYIANIYYTLAALWLYARSQMSLPFNEIDSKLKLLSNVKIYFGFIVIMGQPSAFLIDPIFL